MKQQMISVNSGATNGHELIAKMVEGYATQDLGKIMPLFADHAVYQDMAGGGVHGKTLEGASAIQQYFHMLFSKLMPSHTYENAVIFGEGDRMCASWTLVLGSDLEEEKQFKIRGGDFFVVQDGKVVEKSAFLKLNLMAYVAIARIRLIEWLGLSKRAQERTV